MKYSYSMEMRDGTKWRVKKFDGGGININGDSYEVFFLDHHEKMRCVKQNDVISVISVRTGKPFKKFGNKTIGRHPYAKEAA